MFIELSHKIEAGMKTYPGLPEPRAEVFVDYDGSRARYGGKSEFLIASLHLCGNTGTYVDAPIHRYRGAADLAALPLERLAHLPVTLLDAKSLGRAVGPAAFRDLDVKGRAVLVRTGWSRHWRTDHYYANSPFLTGDACDLLVEKGAVFVGIDSLNIDDVDDLARPAHTRLLAAGIPVCEHLTSLERVQQGDYLHAVPIAWVGGASFPVRAYVMR